jgi:hypothetical protein
MSTSFKNIIPDWNSYTNAFHYSEHGSDEYKYIFVSLIEFARLTFHDSTGIF